METSFRNRIWVEFSKAKYNSIYLSHLITQQRKRVRFLDFGIAVAAALGVVLTPYIDFAALVATSVVAIASFLKALRPVTIMPESMIAIADQQHLFYESYCYKLERLWFEYEAGYRDETSAISQFFTIKQEEDEHIIPTNQISAFFSINTEIIHKKVDEYVKQIFYT